MLKSNMQAKKLAKRIFILLIVSVLLLGVVACNKKGPLRSGILVENHNLTIEGEVMKVVRNLKLQLRERSPRLL